MLHNSDILCNFVAQNTSCLLKEDKNIYKLFEFLGMKKFTLLLGALLFAIASFAAKTTAVVTAGDNASYIAGENVLTVTGLSAEEVGYYGSLVLQVYGWDGGGSSTGYAAILSLEGEEMAFCDDGLMIAKNQEGVLSITGKMLGYPYDYQFDAQVNPKQAKTIKVVSDKMQVGLSPSEQSDLRLTAKANGYAIEIDLFGGVNKQYGTYSANELYASINSSNVSFADTVAGAATLSLENEMAKFEASFIYNMDTLELTLTGFPYAKPEDILPVDTVELHFAGATVQYDMGMNRIEATSANPQTHLFIGYMGSQIATVDVANFSYNSALVVEGDEVSFLRGKIQVKKNGTDKEVTGGLLGNNRVWYNIQLTTEKTSSTAIDNIAVQTTAQKLIKNGQLIIIKDGIEYNAQGTILK